MQFHEFVLELDDIYQSICFSFSHLIKGHFPNFFFFVCVYVCNKYILDKEKEMSVTHFAFEMETISEHIRK